MVTCSCVAFRSQHPFASGRSPQECTPRRDRELVDRPVLRATDRLGRAVGYAPFVVPPKRLGQNRVAIVLPTRTWQAYNFRDDNGDGLGDTWYAIAQLRPARSTGPFSAAASLPTSATTTSTSSTGCLAVASGSTSSPRQSSMRATPRPPLHRAYDALVFPGHHEYVTEAEYDNVEGFRDLGGDLVFLSANNFFWRIDLGARRHDPGRARPGRERAVGAPWVARLGPGRACGHDYSDRTYRRGARRHRRRPSQHPSSPARRARATLLLELIELVLRLAGQAVPPPAPGARLLRRSTHRGGWPWNHALVPLRHRHLVPRRNAGLRDPERPGRARPRSSRDRSRSSAQMET